MMYVNNIQITASGRVLASYADTLYSSLDTGRTWTALPFTFNGSISFVHAVDDAAILLGTDEELYRTSDGGVSWSSLAFPARRMAYDNGVLYLASYYENISRVSDGVYLTAVDRDRAER